MLAATEVKMSGSEKKKLTGSNTTLVFHKTCKRGSKLHVVVVQGKEMNGAARAKLLFCLLDLDFFVAVAA